MKLSKPSQRPRAGLLTPWRTSILSIASGLLVWRPRQMETKRKREFVALVDRIWRLIENDVRESVLIEKA